MFRDLAALIKGSLFALLALGGPNGAVALSAENADQDCAFPVAVHVAPQNMLVVVTESDSLVYQGTDVLVDWQPYDTLTINGIPHIPRPRQPRHIPPDDRARLTFGDAPLVRDLVASGLSWGEAANAWGDSQTALIDTTFQVFQEELRRGSSPDSSISRAFRFLIRSPLVDPESTRIPPRLPSASDMRESAIRVYYRGVRGSLTSNFHWDPLPALPDHHPFCSRDQACAFVSMLREIVENTRGVNVLEFGSGGSSYSAGGAAAEEYIHRGGQR
jgi:hypothetical protein